jgi:hypothetical protein
VGRLKMPTTTLVKKGRLAFGTGVVLEFDKSMSLNVSARDCVDFAVSALRDWYQEAHSTGQRFDAGLLPRDASRWVGYYTGLTAGFWRTRVDGNDTKADGRVFLSPPDDQRRIRIATLAKRGIRLSGLAGKALDVYTKAVATYMADALVVE